MSLRKIRKFHNVVECDDSTIGVIIYESGWDKAKLHEVRGSLDLFEMRILGKALLEFADEMEEVQ